MPCLPPGTPDFFDVIGQVLFDISYFIIITLETREKHFYFLFAISIRRYLSFYPHRFIRFSGF